MKEKTLDLQKWLSLSIEITDKSFLLSPSFPPFLPPFITPSSFLPSMHCLILNKEIIFCIMRKQYSYKDLPGGPLVKNMPPSVGDPDSIPHLGTKVVHAVATKSTCQQSQKKLQVTVIPS